MEDTGRIRELLTPEARAIVFGATADAAIDAELTEATEVDRAHVVMLAERGILPRADAGRLLDAIDGLRAAGFAPLRGRQAPRGLYLLYEHHLIELLGPRTGGALQTGRSRNDHSATTLRLRLRPVYAAALDEACGLLDVLLDRAAAHRDVVMPAYTHGQPAVPITFGHYLAGVASALARDTAWLEGAFDDADRSPLGAGAVGGTRIPVDAARTAALLGFTGPAANSVDAVASRDLVLRILAASAVLGVTLSRLAADLFTWSTQEFAFLALPDTLVGSSSMMPQKRNPFLLEHVKGRSAAPAGGLTAALLAMHATPFSNSIAVGTEGVAHLWPAMRDLTAALTLTRLVLAGARPDPAAMRARAEAGHTGATAVAEQLVLSGALPFRDAHRLVGSAVTAAVRDGGDLTSAVRAAGADVPLGDGAGGGAGGALDADPARAREAAAYGGGPAEAPLAAALATLAERAAGLRRAAAARRARWAAAAGCLDERVDALRTRPNDDHTEETE